MKDLKTLNLTLVNDTANRLSVNLFKGVSYVCVPSADMQCVVVDGSGDVTYDQILADLNSNPIRVTKMKVVAQKEAQLRNAFSYVKSTSTGAVNSSVISPVKYVSAMQSIRTMAEMKFKNPKAIDSTHYLKYSVNPNTSVNLVISFYYINPQNNFRNFCGIIY